MLINTKILILIILSYPLFYLGIGPKYPWILLGNHGQAIGTIIFFSLSLTFVLLTLTSLEKLKFNLIYKIFYINLCLAALVNLAYDFIQYKHFAKFTYQKPNLLYLIDLIWLSYLLTHKSQFSLKQIFGIASLFVIAHNLLSVHYFPLATERSDMLNAIKLAIHQFFNHLDPYQKVSAEIGIPPYLPITIISFIPAYYFNFDFRIMGIIYFGIALLLVYKNLESMDNINQLSLILVILNPYWLMRHDLYFQFFILELVFIILYFPKFNYFLQILILGITIASLQFAWIILAFILLAYTKTIIQLIIKASLSILIAGLCIWLFINNHYLNLFKAIFSHQEYLHSYNFDITFGLSNLFYFAKNQKLLYFFQLSGLFIILAYAIYQFFVKCRYNSNYYLGLGALAYFYFMLSNYFIETYLLMPMLFLISLVPTSNSRLT